jgi:hypothetical protein
MDGRLAHFTRTSLPGNTHVPLESSDEQHHRKQIVQRRFVGEQAAGVGLGYIAAAG